MDWSDERWVKLYTRDTTEWLSLSWRAQGLLCLILRKVNRAGVIDLGRLGKRGLSAHIGGASAWPDVEPALDELLADGCVTVEGSTLTVPNFIDAQTSIQSAAARKRAEREKASAVTFRDKESQGVTAGHETRPEVASASRDVTRRHAASRDVTIDQTRSEETRREERRREGVQRETDASASPPDDAEASPGGSDDAPAEAPAEPAKGKRRSEPRPDASAPLPGTPAARAVASLAATSRLREIVRRPHALCLAAVEAYPAVNVPTEIAKAEAWLIANPANAKRDGDRYLNLWLSRAQERAPRVAGSGPTAPTAQRTQPLPWARPEPVQSGTDRVMIDGAWYDRATQHDEIEAKLARKFGGKRNG